MPTPKKKTSRARRNNRRSHDALPRSFAVVCTNCGEPVLRHRVCTSCGQYRGRQLIKAAGSEA